MCSLQRQESAPVGETGSVDNNKRTAAQVLSHEPGHREISADAGSSQDLGKLSQRNKYRRKLEIHKVLEIEPKK